MARPPAKKRKVAKDTVAQGRTREALSPAAQGIVGMPTDLVRLILDFLNVDDLKSFRQMCRWAEKEAFKTFAIKGYEQVYVETSEPQSMRKLMAILEHNNHLGLASFVKDLTIEFPDLGVAPYYRLPKKAARPLLPQSRGQATQAPKVISLLALLPGVTTLTLHDLSGVALAKHLHLNPASMALQGSPAFRIELATLYLHRARLTGPELSSLISFVSPALTEPHLESVASVDGNWHIVFETMKGSLTSLQRLELNTLYTRGRGASRRPMSFLPVWDSRFSKTFKGSKGIEAIMIQGYEANMKGQQAVQVGLDRMLELVPH